MNSRSIRHLVLCTLVGMTLCGAGCDQTGVADNIGSGRAVQAAAQRNPEQAGPSRTPNTQQPARTPPTRTPPARDRAATQPQAPQVSTNPPPIEFDPPILDFGVVRPNSRHNATVYIQNISDQPLLIERTKASCTCTSVDLANVPLGPGERIAMPLDFHSSIVTGPKTSGVRVFVKGYDFKEFTLKANITLPISAEPSFINGILDPEGNVPRKGEYTIKSLDGKPFHVLGLNTGKPAYVGFDPAKDEYRNTYTLAWDFTMYDLSTCVNPAGQRMPGSIVIETDHPDCPVIDVEVRSECSRRPPKSNNHSWYIQDKRVLAGLMKEGEWFEVEMLAKWFPKITMKDPVNSLENQSSQFVAELVKVEPEKDGFIVRVRVKPVPGYRGLVYSDLILKSANESWPVTVVGTVR